jgi:hypothetical protein
LLDASFTESFDTLLSGSLYNSRELLAVAFRYTLFTFNSTTTGSLLTPFIHLA